MFGSYTYMEVVLVFASSILLGCAKGMLQAASKEARQAEKVKKDKKELLAIVKNLEASGFNVKKMED